MSALLEEVVLKAAKHDEYEEELKKVIQFYKEDFDESGLRSQLLTFSTNDSEGLKMVWTLKKLQHSLKPSSC